MGMAAEGAPPAARARAHQGRPSTRSSAGASTTTSPSPCATRRERAGGGGSSRRRSTPRPACGERARAPQPLSQGRSRPEPGSDSIPSWWCPWPAWAPERAAPRERVKTASPRLPEPGVMQAQNERFARAAEHSRSPPRSRPTSRRSSTRSASPASTREYEQATDRSRARGEPGGQRPAADAGHVLARHRGLRPRGRAPARRPRPRRGRIVEYAYGPALVRSNQAAEAQAVFPAAGRPWRIAGAQRVLARLCAAG